MLKKVVIVGGGTAGWMTASLLSKLTMGALSIELVESEEIGIIGVGEATIPAIKIFNNFVKIKEDEMMRRTMATFKLGIEFVNWREKGHTYIHGFGKIGQDQLWMRFHHLWLKAQSEGKAEDFDNYCMGVVAARKAKFAMPFAAENAPTGDYDYAYQFDATLYGKYLRSLAEENGVKRTEGKIVKVHKDSATGFIKSVELESGKIIEGEFFIDCSGQRSLLLGQELGIGYEEWSKYLLCDSAWAVPCENSPTLLPYTKSIAHDSGWQWRIPLQHRIGNGHVYSSKYIDDDKAREILLQNLDGKPLAEPRLVKFTPGKRKKLFEKNVVAIGLSGGFLEPLESTAIHLIQAGILRLLALFPSNEFSQRDIDEYNLQAEKEYYYIRDFIIAHYKVTNREDTPFWQYCKNMEVPQSLIDRFELFKTSGRFFRDNNELFAEESWVQVLLGQGLQMTPDPMIGLFPAGHAASFIEDVKETIAACVNDMTGHQEFIDQYCKGNIPA